MTIRTSESTGDLLANLKFSDDAAMVRPAGHVDPAEAFRKYLGEIEKDILEQYRDEVNKVENKQQSTVSQGLQPLAFLVGKDNTPARASADYSIRNYPDLYILNKVQTIVKFMDAQRLRELGLIRRYLTAYSSSKRTPELQEFFLNTFEKLKTLQFAVQTFDKHYTDLLQQAKIYKLCEQTEHGQEDVSLEGNKRLKEILQIEDPWLYVTAVASFPDEFQILAQFYRKFFAELTAPKIASSEVMIQKIDKNFSRFLATNAKFSALQMQYTGLSQIIPSTNHDDLSTDASNYANTLATFATTLLAQQIHMQRLYAENEIISEEVRAGLKEKSFTAEKAEKLLAAFKATCGFKNAIIKAYQRCAMTDELEGHFKALRFDIDALFGNIASAKEANLKSVIDEIKISHAAFENALKQHQPFFKLAKKAKPEDPKKAKELKDALSAQNNAVRELKKAVGDLEKLANTKEASHDIAVARQASEEASASSSTEVNPAQKQPILTTYKALLGDVTHHATVSYKARRDTLEPGLPKGLVDFSKVLLDERKVRFDGKNRHWSELKYKERAAYLRQQTFFKASENETSDLNAAERFNTIVEDLKTLDQEITAERINAISPSSK